MSTLFFDRKKERITCRTIIQIAGAKTDNTGAETELKRATPALAACIAN